MAEEIEKCYFFASDPKVLVMRAIRLFVQEDLLGNETDYPCHWETRIEALGLTLRADGIDDCGELEPNKWLDLFFDNGDEFRCGNSGFCWANHEIDWNKLPFKFMRQLYIPDYIWDIQDVDRVPSEKDFPGYACRRYEDRGLNITLFVSKEGNEFKVVEDPGISIRVVYTGHKWPFADWKRTMEDKEFLKSVLMGIKNDR